MEGCRKMSIKKLLAVILSVFVLCAILTACGDDADTNSREFQNNTAAQGYDSGTEENVIHLRSLFFQCVEYHNAVVSLLDTGMEAGLEFEQDFIDLVNEIADELRSDEAVILSDEAWEIDLEGSIEYYIDSLEMLKEVHATLVEAIQEAGYEVN